VKRERVGGMGGGARIEGACVRGMHLVHECEVLPSAHPHIPVRLEALDEPKRAIVHGAPGNKAVVRVEIALR
jgi:hypothetical protein